MVWGRIKLSRPQYGKFIQTKLMLQGFPRSLQRFCLYGPIFAIICWIAISWALAPPRLNIHFVLLLLDPESISKSDLKDILVDAEVNFMLVALLTVGAKESTPKSTDIINNFSSIYHHRREGT